MIKNFLHKGLEKLFLDGTSAGVDAKHTPKLLRLLDRLNAAEDVRDMQFPGSGLHPLKGDLKNFWAVKVSVAWRLLFRFTDKTPTMWTTNNITEVQHGTELYPPPDFPRRNYQV